MWFNTCALLFLACCNLNPACCLAVDMRGAFVQPALYEAFGLTVIEAMTCGLPCFATNRGGPAEIIKNGISGYHIECAPRMLYQGLLWGS